MAAFGYLTSPPEDCGAGPIATRPQLLLLSSLGPKGFERLCFRLTRLDATVEQCRFYGVHGQAQKGIDRCSTSRGLGSSPVLMHRGHRRCCSSVGSPGPDHAAWWVIRRPSALLQLAQAQLVP